MKKLLLIGFLFIALAFAVSANPVLTDPGNKVLAEGEVLTFTLLATAADSGTSVFSVTSAQSFISVIANTGVVTLAPGFTDSGVYSVNYSVSDSNSVSSYTKTVTVNDNKLGLIDITLGGSNQARSNPDADDEEDEVVTKKETFTVTNNGPVDISALTITHTATGYTVNFTGLPSTLASGDTATVTIEGIIPDDLDSYFPDRKDNDDRALEIGAIRIIGNANGAQFEETSKLFMEAENFLEIDEVMVFINGEEKHTFSSDDKKIDDVVPGDVIEFRVIADNKYDDSDPEDIYINSVTLRVLIEESTIDIDDEEDFEDDLDPKSSSEAILEFDVDEDADNGDHEILVFVEGEDDNGAIMGEVWILKLDVTQKSYQERIINIDVPDELDCNERLFDMSVEFKNVGSKKDKEVSIKVSSDDFNYNERLYDIELDSGDDNEEIFTIPVPNGISIGANFVEIEVFHQRSKDKYGDSRIVQVTVPDCSDEPVTPPPATDDEAEEDSADETEVIFVDNSDVSDTLESDGVIVASDVSTSTESAFGSNALVIVLIVVAILALAAIGVSLALLMKLKNQQ